MPLPNTWTTVVVRGKFLSFDGEPLRGRISFTPSFAVWADTADDTTIAARALSAPLDVRGGFALALPTTDIGPAGWLYHVREPTGRSYDITLPASPGIVELSDLTPVTSGGSSSGDLYPSTYTPTY